MKKMMLIVLAAAAIVAGSVLIARGGAAVQGPPHGRGPGGHGPGLGLLNPRLMDELDLTDAQREQIRTLVDAHRTAVEPLHDQLKSNRDAINEASLAANFDEARVRALAASAQTIHTDLVVAEARLTSQIYALLTPEQRTELGQLLAEMRERGPGKRR